jgi:hypothetical protein
MTTELKTLWEHGNDRLIKNAYNKAMQAGFYITQRGEGRIWFLHAPDGRTCLMAETREGLLEKIPHQFK